MRTNIIPPAGPGRPARHEVLRDTPRAGRCRALVHAGLVIAGLAAALLHPDEAAAAKMNACQVKHSYCSERCIMRNKSVEAESMCIRRTCDRQNPGCGADSYNGKGDGTGGGKGAGKGKSRLVASPSGPIVAGPIKEPRHPRDSGPIRPKTGPITGKPAQDIGRGGGRMSSIGASTRRR